MSEPTAAEQLVVAISSRALFDFEEENKVFETADDREYMRLQLERLDSPAKPGVAYPLVRKLEAFNADGVRRVEVVILSRNDPVSGLRVFRSVKGASLGIERGVFTRGRAPFSYLRPLKANLFLSANGDDVRGALNAGFPAAMVYTQSLVTDSHPDEVRIAFDGDAVRHMAGRNMLRRGFDVPRLVVEKEVRFELAQERSFFPATQKHRLVDINVPVHQCADRALVRGRAARGHQRRA